MGWETRNPVPGAESLKTKTHELFDRPDISPTNNLQISNLPTYEDHSTKEGVMTSGESEGILPQYPGCLFVE